MRSTVASQLSDSPCQHIAWFLIPGILSEIKDPHLKLQFFNAQQADAFKKTVGNNVAVSRNEDASIFVTFKELPSVLAVLKGSADYKKLYELIVKSAPPRISDDIGVPLSPLSTMFQNASTTASIKQIKLDSINVGEYVTLSFDYPNKLMRVSSEVHSFIKNFFVDYKRQFPEAKSLDASHTYFDMRFEHIKHFFEKNTKYQELAHFVNFAQLGPIAENDYKEEKDHKPSTTTKKIPCQIASAGTTVLFKFGSVNDKKAFAAIALEPMHPISDNEFLTLHLSELSSIIQKINLLPQYSDIAKKLSEAQTLHAAVADAPASQGSIHLARPVELKNVPEIKVHSTTLKCGVRFDAEGENLYVRFDTPEQLRILFQKAYDAKPQSSSDTTYRLRYYEVETFVNRVSNEESLSEYRFILPAIDHVVQKAKGELPLDAPYKASSRALSPEPSTQDAAAAQTPLGAPPPRRSSLPSVASSPRAPRRATASGAASTASPDRSQHSHTPVPSTTAQLPVRAAAQLRMPPRAFSRADTVSTAQSTSGDAFASVAASDHSREGSCLSSSTQTAYRERQAVQFTREEVKELVEHLNKDNQEHKNTWKVDHPRDSIITRLQIHKDQKKFYMEPTKIYIAAQDVKHSENKDTYVAMLSAFKLKHKNKLPRIDCPNESLKAAWQSAFRQVYPGDMAPKFTQRSPVPDATTADRKRTRQGGP